MSTIETKPETELETHDPVEPTTVADALNAAANYIEAHGWTQGTFENRLGEVCLMGAVERAILPTARPQFFTVLADGKQLFLDWKVRQALLKLLGAHPPHWNDAEERTQSDVVDLLRVAAMQEANK